jgi:hypothetical protein
MSGTVFSSQSRLIRQRKKPPRSSMMLDRGGFEKIPAMTDFRAKGTIMGLAGLTAVFGMGTGGTPPVSSPEIRPGGPLDPPGRTLRWCHAEPDQSGSGARFTNHT